MLIRSGLSSASAAASSSAESGMIDLTEEGEERKEAAVEPIVMEVEEEKKDEPAAKEEKEEKVKEEEDEDRLSSWKNKQAPTLHEPLSSYSTTIKGSPRPPRPLPLCHHPLLSRRCRLLLPILHRPLLPLPSSCPHSRSQQRSDSARAAHLRPIVVLPPIRPPVPPLPPHSTQLQQLLTLYFASLPPAAFQQHVARLQNYLSLQLTALREVNESTMGALHVLSTLFSAYQLARTRQRLLVDDVSLFVNDVVNSDVDISDDYHYHFGHKLNSDSHITDMQHFTWTRHSRFLYTTEVKSEMIHHWLGAHWTAEQVQQAALPTQALTIHMSRQRLVPDLLNAIARTRMERGAVELRKPLHVVFSGEEGIDAGGLKKEAITLACESMFNAQYGMFVWSEETRTFFFNPHCQAHDSVEEMKGEYQLLGTVIGMALLNNVLLPNVAFPPVVYAKLLGLPLSFVDLQSSFPQLYQSLSAILSYDGKESVEDVFGLTFAVDSEVMGVTHSHPLVPNGESIPVTATNRCEYVKLFTKYQLEDSIAVQFDAFARGFWSVLPRHLLAPLVQPADLELLVCGQREMDFVALENAHQVRRLPAPRSPAPAPPPPPGLPRPPQPVRPPAARHRRQACTPRHQALLVHRALAQRRPAAPPAALCDGQRQRAGEGVERGEAGDCEWWE